MRNPLAVAIASILLAMLAPGFLKKKEKETIGSTKPDEPISVESAPSASGNNGEVFLSFRGIDTRTGFTDHLHSSLVDAGVSVFRDDDELRISEKIGPDLLRAIRSSKISIPILSPHYASSKWCLRKLAGWLTAREVKGTSSCPYSTKPSPGMSDPRRGVSGRPFIKLRSIMRQRWSNDGNELSKK
ncbi:hypothetical protein ACJRO7_013638 [Eucalyptus globulus]|uniref:ADP-ribosyl cyclase/cyclic ADP-ribose hydrolase n=1 Tax=Eucalyptus globulus TaxID=34317 RepID=A0ABD3L3J0_EUCGL